MWPLRISSSDASSRSFSVKGSPTCTRGRLASLAAERSSEANEAPWIPSRPVRAPTAMIGLPTPCALARDQLLFAHEPHAHRVDQRVPLVRRIEDDLAGDGRDADAVAVVADPLHHAGEEPAHARRVQRSEAQRVEHRDGAGAHREDVAQDAADAGRCALVRLDRRRMVVRLDLEGDGQAITDGDDAGVFARALQHVRRRGGQRAEQRARMLVRAVLVPQRAHHARVR